MCLGEREYWVFATPDRCRYHSDILSAFLAEMDVSVQRNENGAFELEPDIRVLGGGLFRCDRRSRELVLYDDSTIFGRFDSDGAADKLAACDHPWSGLRVKVF